jgi:hypothetical protein
LARAIELVEYHIRRNKVAKASHDKTWRQKHKKVESPSCPGFVAGPRPPGYEWRQDGTDCPLEGCRCEPPPWTICRGPAA